MTFAPRLLLAVAYRLIYRLHQVRLTRLYELGLDGLMAFAAAMAALILLFGAAMDAVEPTHTDTTVGVSPHQGANRVRVLGSPLPDPVVVRAGWRTYRFFIIYDASVRGAALSRGKGAAEATVGRAKPMPQHIRAAVVQEVSRRVPPGTRINSSLYVNTYDQAASVQSLLLGLACGAIPYLVWQAHRNRYLVFRQRPLRGQAAATSGSAGSWPVVAVGSFYHADRPRRFEFGVPAELRAMPSPGTGWMLTMQPAPPSRPGRFGLPENDRVETWMARLPAAATVVSGDLFLGWRVHPGLSVYWSGQQYHLGFRSEADLIGALAAGLPRQIGRNPA